MVQDERKTRGGDDLDRDVADARKTLVRFVLREAARDSGDAGVDLSPDLVALIRQAVQGAVAAEVARLDAKGRDAAAEARIAAAVEKAINPQISTAFSELSVQYHQLSQDNAELSHRLDQMRTAPAPVRGRTAAPAGDFGDVLDQIHQRLDALGGGGAPTAVEHDGGFFGRLGANARRHPIVSAGLVAALLILIVALVQAWRTGVFAPPSPPSAPTALAGAVPLETRGLHKLLAAAPAERRILLDAALRELAAQNRGCKTPGALPDGPLAEPEVQALEAFIQCVDRTRDSSAPPSAADLKGEPGAALDKLSRWTLSALAGDPAPAP